MVDIIEIYVHWYAGRSKGAVATSLRIDRKTVRNYLRPAEQAGIVPGGPPMSQEDWAKLIRSWYPQLADRRLRQVRWGELDAHHEFIKELLPVASRATIRQRLRDERGLDISEPTLRRWLHATMPEWNRSVAKIP